MKRPPGETGYQAGSRSSDYFRAVEERFTVLRGGAATLTPADWDLVRSWERRGIPKPLVLKAIETVMSRRARASPRMPLRACAGAVDAAFRAVRRRSSGARRGTPLSRPASVHRSARLPPEPGDDLGRLRRGLRDWTPPGPEVMSPPMLPALREAVAAGVAEIVRLERSALHPAALETRLAAIERRLLDRLAACMVPDLRRRIRVEAARALAPHRRRLPEPAYREAEFHAVRGRMAEAAGFPRLTRSD